MSIRSGRGADLSRRRFRVGLALIGLLGALVSVCLSTFLFPRLTGNSDEGAYLAQAETLAGGHLFNHLPDVGRSAYLPWFATARDGVVVYKYTPVFSAVLATSIRVSGSALPALAAVAGVTVVLVAALARLLGAERRPALLAGLLFLLAPGIVLQTGAYLPYLFTLALLLGSSCCAIVGRSAGREAVLVVGGLAWGFACFSRPYDAVLFAVPVLFLLVRHTNRPIIAARTVALFAVGAVPVIVLFLAYNSAATGSALRLPFTQVEPRDNLGFGRHRVLPQNPYIDYTPSRAVWSIGIWLGLVANSILGGLLFFALGVYGLFRDRASRWRRTPWAFAPLLMAAWIIGYSFFWGIYAVATLWTGAVFLGPYYFLPVLVVLSISGAQELHAMPRRSPVVLAGVLIGLLATAGAVSFLARENLVRTRARTAVADEVDAALASGSPQLLLLPPYRGPYLQHPFSWLRNQPDFNGTTRYALVTPPAVFDVIDDSAGRSVYLLSIPRNFGDWNASVADSTVTEQTVLSGSSIDLVSTIEAGSSAGGVVRITGGGTSCDMAPVGRRVDLHVGLLSGEPWVVARSGTSSCMVDLPHRAGYLSISQRRAGAATQLALPWRLRGGNFDVLAPGEVRTWVPDLGLSVAAAPN